MFDDGGNSFYFTFFFFLDLDVLVFSVTVEATSFFFSFFSLSHFSIRTDLNSFRLPCDLTVDNGQSTTCDGIRSIIP